MNSIAKPLLWNGSSQYLMQQLLLRIRNTCCYHRLSLKHKLTSHKTSEEDCDALESGHVSNCTSTHFEENSAFVHIALPCESPKQESEDEVREYYDSGSNIGFGTPRKNPTITKVLKPGPLLLSEQLPPSSRLACDDEGPTPTICSSENSASSDEDATDGGGGAHWEVAAGGRPPIGWDPDVAAECERSTLLSAPLPTPAVPERHRQADAAADAQLRRQAGGGRLTAALRTAAALSAAGTPPPFGTLALLADEAARRADPAAFERARRLAARLYPLNYGRAARLRDSQLELLWRRRLFAPACGLLLRYRSEPVRRQLMARRFAVCCCLAAREGIEDALPHIQVRHWPPVWG